MNLKWLVVWVAHTTQQPTSDLHGPVRGAGAYIDVVFAGMMQERICTTRPVDTPQVFAMLIRVGQTACCQLALVARPCRAGCPSALAL